MAAVFLCFTAWALPWPVNAQAPTLRLPPAAEPDVRLERLQPIEPPPRAREIEVPEAAPSRAPSGADNIRFTLSGLDLEGVTAYSQGELESIYGHLIGKEVSLAAVYDIASEIQLHYRKGGYFLTRVIVPPQVARDGRLTLRVLEGYVSDVQLEGSVGPVSDLVRAYLQHVVQERPLKLKTLERYLLLAKDVPGLDVQGVLRPAPDQVGAAQLVAKVERKWFEAALIGDNIGSTFTGEWEVAAILSTNSFTAFGENVTVTGLVSSPEDTFSGDADNQKVIQVGGSFRPVSNGFYCNLLGSYGDSNPGEDLARLDFDSTKLLLSAVGGYPFIRSRDLNVSAELGFDYINSDTDVLGDERVSRDRLRVLHLTGLVDFRDAWRGSTYMSGSIRQGLPIFDASESGDKFLSRADGTGVSTALRGEVWRVQPLISYFSLLGRFGWQYAFSNLLSDEEFDAGGTHFGRGYDPKEISGDHGVGFTGELQYTRSLNVFYVDTLQLFGFYDVGKVWDRGTDDSVSLSSAGGGVRCWLAGFLSIELGVAKPLTLRSQRADDTRDPQLLFRASARY